MPSLHCKQSLNQPINNNLKTSHNQGLLSTKLTSLSITNCIPPQTNHKSATPPIPTNQGLSEPTTTQSPIGTLNYNASEANHRAGMFVRGSQVTLGWRRGGDMERVMSGNWLCSDQATTTRQGQGPS